MLEKMRQAAAEQAKKAAEVAAHGAGIAADKAGEAASAGLERAGEIARDPATQAKAKLVARDAARVTAKGAAAGAGAAGKAVKSALDKLNPDLLAGIVIKATAIQEQANAVLRRNRSLYRIGGIEIGAAFPPSISFQIIRAAELELEEQAMGILPEPGIASAELDAEGLADALGDEGAAVVDARVAALGDESDSGSADADGADPAG